MTPRDATELDLPAIVEIHNAAIASRISTAQLNPLTVDERRRWFQAHSPGRHPLWVVELGGALAGWLSFKDFLPRAAYRGTAELSVYVHESFRRRGVAKRLLAEAIMRAQKLGMHALVGLIFAQNEGSVALFRSAGFEQWGLLPGVARIYDQLRDLTIFGRRV
jgi:L-amino acid N-acyltransferase YncA